MVKTFNDLLHLETSSTILISGPSGIGKTYSVQKYAEQKGLVVHTINILYLVKEHPYDYASGIFRVFQDIKQNCIVHFDNIVALFPTKAREDLYGALLLGYLHVKDKYQVIIVGELVDQELLNSRVRDMFMFKICMNSLSLKESEQELYNIINRLNREIKTTENLSGLSAVEDKFAFNQDEIKILLGVTTNYTRGDYASLYRILSKINLNAKFTLNSLINVMTANIPRKMFINQDKLEITKWSDIGGYKREKKLLEESIQWFYQKKEVFDLLGIKPSIGTLLYGPPGCGKTLLAKSVANEVGATFMPVSIPDFIKGEVGESEKQIAKLFAKARELSPAIIFIDEIDSLFSNRQSGLSNKLYAQLVAELDTLSYDNSQVVILAATNYIDRIDPALLRPSRIDRLINILPPDDDDRRKILYLLLDKSRIAYVDLVEELVALSKNMTGSDLKECIRKASILAIQRDGVNPKICRDDFLNAFNF